MQKIFFLLIFQILLCSCNSNKDLIICDCENGDNDIFVGFTKSKKFINTEFKNTNCKTTIKYKSSISSIMLFKNKPYGMTYILKDVIEKEKYKVQVWRHVSNQNGSLVVSADDVNDFYLEQNKSNNIVDGEWQQLSFDFIIPHSVNEKNLKIYVYSYDTIPVYFDDLSIELVSNQIKNPKIKKSIFTDNRDGKKYETIKIGNDWWMAENLSFKLNDSCYCYNKNENNSEIYGRFYNYNSAIKACPAGWHIPSDEEWKQLEKQIGMDEIEIQKYGWRGNDESLHLREYGKSGFNIKMAGALTKTFYNTQKNAYFWTSTEIDKNNAYCREIASKLDIGRFKDNKEMKFSVRCVKNR